MYDVYVVEGMDQMLVVVHHNTQQARLEQPVSRTGYQLGMKNKEQTVALITHSVMIRPSYLITLRKHVLLPQKHVTTVYI